MHVLHCARSAVTITGSGLWTAWRVCLRKASQRFAIHVKN